MQQAINNILVEDAIQVYELLLKQNTEIPAELKQSLLELLAFYNGAQAVGEDSVEQRYFSDKNVKKTHWVQDCLAEKIFVDLKDGPDANKAYSAMIAGLCAHNKVIRAYEFYCEALEKSLTLTIEAFNGIISVSGSIKERADLNWELIQDVLKTMASSNIQPNADTLNAVLSVLVGYNQFLGRSYADHILAEFKQLGVEPTLASWHYVLLMNYYDNDTKTDYNKMAQILKEVECKPIVIQSVVDSDFFVTAMSVCLRHSLDQNVVHQIHRMVSGNPSQQLLISGTKHQRYYRTLLSALSLCSDIDEYMKVHESIVPSLYLVDAMTLTNVLRAIDVSGAIQHISRIWSDIYVLNLTYHDILMRQLVTTMIKNPPVEGIKEQEFMSETYASIATDIIIMLKDAVGGSYYNRQLQAEQYGELIVLLGKNNNHAQILDAFISVVDNKVNVKGDLLFGPLQQVIQSCKSEKSPNTALRVIEYAVQKGVENHLKLAKLTLESFTLSENHYQRLEQLIGANTVKALLESSVD